VGIAGHQTGIDSGLGHWCDCVGENVAGAWAGSGEDCYNEHVARSWELAPRNPGASGGVAQFLPAGDSPVRNALGFMLQMAVLMFLPLVIGWQLFFGFPLLAMPAATLLAVVVFSLGHSLRQRP